MFNLCVSELAEVVHGRLQLASMPPLAGGYEPIRRIIVDSRQARPGDVYWALSGPGYDGMALVDDAFARGALGAVTAGRHVEPWAGRFCIEVEQTNRAFCHCAKCFRELIEQEKSPIVLDFPQARSIQRRLAHGDETALHDLVTQLQKRSIAVAV